MPPPDVAPTGTVPLETEPPDPLPGIEAVA
jgi:hypothetical protein